MIETLVHLDRELFLFLNTSLINPFFNFFFPFITEFRNWLYLLIPGILYFIWKMFSMQKLMS